MILRPSASSKCFTLNVSSSSTLAWRAGGRRSEVDRRHRQRVGTIALVHHGDVVAPLLAAARFVNVAEYVQRGPYPRDGSRQFLAADALASDDSIEHTSWRPMGHEDVDAVRDQRRALRELRRPNIERPHPRDGARPRHRVQPETGDADFRVR